MLLLTSIIDLRRLDCSKIYTHVYSLWFCFTNSVWERARSLFIIFMRCSKQYDFSAPFGFLGFVLLCFLFVLLFSQYIIFSLPTFRPLFFSPLTAPPLPCSIKAIQSRHPVSASCVICQGDSNALFLFIFEQCLHYQCVRCTARQY